MSSVAALDYQDALERWLRASPAGGVERLAVNQARGRVLAEPVSAGDHLPPFDNAAMDGYALRMQQDHLAAGSLLNVAGAQYAGDGPQSIAAEATEITTGALLPQGFDAVVPVEQIVMEAPGRIRLTAAVNRGQHIRRRGEDIAAGTLVMPAGRVIDVDALTLITALGVAELAVASRPRLAVIATGRELVDDPNRPLQAGQIRNCNRPGLAARMLAAGAECVYQTTIGDDGEALIDAIAAAEAAGAQLVLSSGAVSMGRHDFVPATLQRLGAELLFHRLRMRPGKPLLAARLPSGLLYAGLPGNPVSAMVGFRFFVEPMLRRMLGMPDEHPVSLPLVAPLAARGGVRFHLKAALQLGGDGRLGVQILAGQESFRLAPLLAATAWAVLPADSADLAAGEPIAVHPLCHLQPFPFIEAR